MATKKTTPIPSKAKATPVTKPAAKKHSPKPVAKVIKAPAKASKAAAKTSKKAVSDSADLDVMFDLAAETFRVMSAPMRLKIINCLCTEEKNVGQLLEEIDTTQPNMSQHLNTLFKAKILGRRREGVQIYYRIINERVVTLCRAVCTQIAIDSDIEHA
jgi:DNA-binding transcriptional ArsR family regulator